MVRQPSTRIHFSSFPSAPFSVPVTPSSVFFFSIFAFLFFQFVFMFSFLVYHVGLKPLFFFLPLFLLFDFVVWRAGEASNEETTHIFEIDGQTEAVFGGGEGEAWVPCLDATPRTFFFVVLAFLVAVWTTSVPGMFVFGGAKTCVRLHGKQNLFFLQPAYYGRGRQSISKNWGTYRQSSTLPLAVVHPCSGACVRNA